MISQTVKNFLVEFERNIVPHMNKGDDKTQLVTCYVSASTLLDPQLQELLEITSGSKEGEFMGVVVKGKPDMTFETYYKDTDV